MPKKYCFIHSCNLPNSGLAQLKHLINLINSSGLIDILDTVFIVNIGRNIFHNFGDKYNIINWSEDPLLFENPTINRLIEFSKINPNSHILYLHTKGISHTDNNLSLRVTDWTNMMLYFLVEKYDECISKLETYDVVGCNFNKQSNEYLSHFSGNFWWANSKYLQTLELLDETNNPSRTEPEFHLFKKDPTYFIMHQSNVNHYHQCYPRSLYANDNK